MSKLKQLLAELRRRKVLGVAGIYLVVGWAVLQVGDVVVEPLDLPGWTMTLLIVLVALGLPLALVVAWAFQVTPDGIKRDEGGAAVPVPAPAAARVATVRRSGWFVLGALVAMLIAWFAIDRDSGGDAALDANAVAVLPFRVAGADPQIAYLREGMLDLLAAKLTGEGGPRAVDPRATMAVWRRSVEDEREDLPPEAARAVARRLGARTVLLGDLVSTPGRVVITASVHDVEDGDADRPISVEGPADSIPALVDRLAASLLSAESREASDRLASLTSTSLPALRAYLEGQALYRRARYEEAERAFDRALALDSTFALAALGRYQASVWGIPPKADNRALALAWAGRDRLSERDRIFLIAVAGPRYPEPAPYVERIAARERAVEALPDRPEAWFELGDHLMHYGGATDIEGHLDRAWRAFERALELDPDFGAALQHLADVASVRRDSAAFRHYRDLYLARDPSELYRFAYQWASGAIFGDTAAVNTIRAGLDTLGVEMLSGLIFSPQLWGVQVELAEEAAPLLLSRAQTADERAMARRLWYELALNRGRPARALEVIAGQTSAIDPVALARMHVEAALFVDGDSSAGAAGARALAETVPDGHAGWRDRCALEQWRLWRGETATAVGTAAHLRSSADESAASRIGRELCADLIETLLATIEEQPDAAVRIERLDAVLATGPPVYPLREQANLTMTRLLDARGEHTAALRAVRRRVLAPGAELYLASFLREEGRLAALTGDAPGAIRAYQHYLALRSDPEPVLEAEVARVRAELTRLVGEAR